ncbi:MAG: hypothetical protein K0S14_2662, partial [Thermomicrobiales bacterium]|nr:hypothetical protein [Thermomicrobiales bacterium]
TDVSRHGTPKRLTFDLACDRRADLDEHPLQIAHVGDGLTPRFGRGRGDDDRPSRERRIPGSGNIVRDEGDLDAGRRLPRLIAAVTAGEELSNQRVAGK